MPAMGVRPPLFTLAAVRAMAPVAGMPPNSTEPMLPTPCATSSMLQRWWPEIMESATTHDSSDSMAARMAMVMPLANSSRNKSRLSWGNCSVGRPASMVYRSPMVLTCRPNADTMAAPTITATSEPGMRLDTFGHSIRMARHTTPTSTACQFTVEMLAARAPSLSVVSMVAVPAGYVSPSKSLIWPTKMVTAIPAVKPVVMV